MEIKSYDSLLSIIKDREKQIMLDTERTARILAYLNCAKSMESTDGRETPYFSIKDGFNPDTKILSMHIPIITNLHDVLLSPPTAPILQEGQSHKTTLNGTVMKIRGFRVGTATEQEGDAVAREICFELGFMTREVPTTEAPPPRIQTQRRLYGNHN